MKPRTKLQKQVYSLNKNLNPIGKDKHQWAYKNCLEHIGYRNKSNVFCLDCGNVWDGLQKAKDIVCPACRTKLEIRDTRKKKLDQLDNVFAVIEVVEDFQVLRLFQIKSWHKAGEKPVKNIKEVVQHWFKPEGKATVIARYQASGSTGFYGDMEIRTNLATYWNSNKYDLYVDKIAPGAECLPIFERNGVSSNVTEVNLFTFFQNILHDNKLETLIKSGQYDLCSHRNGRRANDIHRFWDSIKICIRQNFIITDGKTWLDYLDLLAYFKKDLRNPKFICTPYLDQEHNKLVAKKAARIALENAARIERDEVRRLAEIERAEREKQERIDNIEKDNIQYIQRFSKFFDISFGNSQITFQVLQSVAEFKQEGDLHIHCVFTNEYYKKEDSLILCAKVDGLSVETIEISLKQMRIEQARGFDNKPSKYHDEIIRLVNKNMYLIKRCMKPIKVKKVVNQQMGAVA